MPKIVEVDRSLWGCGSAFAPVENNPYLYILPFPDKTLLTLRSWSRQARPSDLQQWDSELRD